MPLRQKRLKLTQTDSDAKLDDSVQILINDSGKQIEKTQGPIAGTENGFLCRKWPQYPFVWFYAKIWNTETVMYATEAQ